MAESGYQHAVLSIPEFTLFGLQAPDTVTVPLLNDWATVPAEPYGPSMDFTWLDEVEPLQEIPLSEVYTFMESFSSQAPTSPTTSSVASSTLPSVTHKGSNSKKSTALTTQQKYKSKKLLREQKVRIVNPGLSGALPSITLQLPLPGGPRGPNPQNAINISTPEAFHRFVKQTLGPTITNIMICKMIGSPNAFASNRRPTLVPSGVDKTRIPILETPSRRLFNESFHVAKFRLSSIVGNDVMPFPSKFDSCYKQNFLPVHFLQRRYHFHYRIRQDLMLVTIASSNC